MLRNKIIKKFDDLPYPLKKEALDFIEFLSNKATVISYPNNKHKTLNFDWENALEELKPKYSSIKLQKKSLEWR